MAYESVPDGELAAVVTYLEMLAPREAPVPSSPLALRRIEHPDPAAYRRLFRLVGARWLWFSRLVMDDDALAAIIGHPRVELHSVLDSAGDEVGLLELDFRQGGECELAFIGLVPELAGQGHGRWLLAEALRLAWRQDDGLGGIARVHVHTCTLDHPAALPAYRRAGFTAYRRAIERFPDPRLLGILAADCAPQLPVVGTLASAAPPPAS
ncbi:GNAT family N-acetyltransferase [Sphingomonas sp.]|uniref:GNAT family N-acetyltransferase n=1 Tax=Sphingomonas sp. TaxID=28214 RepID=UPI0017F3EC64|nr:GNAT family N-acetyltransferase [Sphingomonas sp.]MBA3511013.1 GNAT family N-acetyltransferase [Sphingomonas sp.]